MLFKVTSGALDELRDFTVVLLLIGRLRYIKLYICIYDDRGFTVIGFTEVLFYDTLQSLPICVYIFVMLQLLICDLWYSLFYE